MSIEPAVATEYKIILIRPGIGAETYCLARGATVGDLLREAAVQLQDQAIMVSGREVEPNEVLQPHMVVSIVPRSNMARTKQTWRDTVGMFRGDPIFREILEEGRAIRRSERETP